MSIEKAIFKLAIGIDVLKNELFLHIKVLEKYQKVEDKKIISISDSYNCQVHNQNAHS
jgi:hypothetical protein